MELPTKTCNFAHDMAETLKEKTAKGIALCWNNETTEGPYNGRMYSICYEIRKKHKL